VQLVTNRVSKHNIQHRILAVPSMHCAR
jgi:hypothetical protein